MNSYLSIMNVYLDWNIMSQMKQGHLKRLESIFSSNDSLNVIYSTSHISDLFISYNGTRERQNLIDEDLKYISNLTNNYCLYIEYGHVVLKQYDPFSLFQQRVDELEHSQSDDWIENTLSNFEPGSIYHDQFLEMKDMPLPEAIIDALKNPDVSSRFLEYYPGLTVNSKLSDLLNIGFRQFRNLMESNSYQEMRSKLQNALNISPNTLADENIFSGMEKLYHKDSPNYENIIKQYNDNSPHWFQEISNNYLMLDMHGFYQDKIKVTPRSKKTMRNTIDDGFHAAFASVCDVYITKDGKAVFKTKAVYEKLNIRTKIFKPNEFIDFIDKLDIQKNQTTITDKMEIDLQFLKDSDETLRKINELEDESEKRQELKMFIVKSKALLLQFGLSINSMLANQQLIINTFNTYNDSIAKLLQRIEGVEKLNDVFSDHLGALDSITDSHSSHLDIHDRFIDLLSNRIDSLEK